MELNPDFGWPHLFIAAIVSCIAWEWGFTHPFTLCVTLFVTLISIHSIWQMICKD